MTKRKQRKMELLQSIRPTSVTSLKMQCLIASNGNIEEAKKIYDFFADGMEGLPMTDPVPPSFMDNAKTTVNGTLEWVKENQDTIAQIYDFLRGVFSKRKAAPPTVEPLPPIN